MRMDADIKTAWVEALESGEYEQGKRVLHNMTDNTFCCLGVLCDLAVRSGEVDIPVKTQAEVLIEFNDDGEQRRGTVGVFGDHSYTTLPPEVMTWAGIESDTGDYVTGTNNTVQSLTHRNDSGTSFMDIATIIKEHF